MSYASTVPDAEGNILVLLLILLAPGADRGPVVYATWGAPQRELAARIAGRR